MPSCHFQEDVFQGFLSALCCTHESNASFLHNELPADPKARSELTLLLLCRGLNVPKEPWQSPVWRGQVVRRVSLAWRGSFIIPEGLLVRLHCWGVPEIKIFLTVSVIWKHFRCVLSKVSWNIPVVQSCVC